MIVSDDGILLHFETFTEVFDMYGESVVWDYVEEIYIVLYEEYDEDDEDDEINEINEIDDDEGYYSEYSDNEVEEDIPEGY